MENHGERQDRNEVQLRNKTTYQSSPFRLYQQLTMMKHERTKKKKRKERMKKKKKKNNKQRGTNKKNALISVFLPLQFPNFPHLVKIKSKVRIYIAPKYGTRGDEFINLITCYTVNLEPIAMMMRKLSDETKGMHYWYLSDHPLIYTLTRISVISSAYDYVQSLPCCRSPNRLRTLLQLHATRTWPHVLPISRIPRPTGSSACQQFWFRILLYEINILMTDTEFVNQINTRF